MATSTNTTRVDKAKADAFMCKLFDPLPDAELADPEMEKISKKAAREAWKSAMADVSWANALRSVVSYYGYAVRLGCKPAYAPGVTDMQAREAHFEAIDRAMHVPAPNVTALKWKRDHFKAGAGRGVVPEDGRMVREFARLLGVPIDPPNRRTTIAQREKIIAADEARLGLNPNA